MRKFGILTIAIGAAAMMSACGPTTRIVTAHKWLTQGDTTSYYVAYWEGVQGTKGRSALKRCKLNTDDNVLACREDAAVAKALNPED